MLGARVAFTPPSLASHLMLCRPVLLDFRPRYPWEAPNTKPGKLRQVCYANVLCIFSNLAVLIFSVSFLAVHVEPLWSC